MFIVKNLEEKNSSVVVITFFAAIMELIGVLSGFQEVWGKVESVELVADMIRLRLS